MRPNYKRIIDPSISYERFLHQEIDRYFFIIQDECGNCRNEANPRIKDALGRQFCCEACLEDFQEES